MKKDLTGIILVIITIICFISGGYFFSQLNLSITDLVVMNLTNITTSIISINFFCFIILSSIGIGVLISLSSFYEEKKTIIFAVTGYLIGVSLAILIFGLIEFALILILTTISIPFALKSTLKAREYKTFPIIRAGCYASSKIILGLGVSCFLGLLIITVPQAQILENNFANQLLASTVGEGITLSEDFTLKLAESISLNQIKTMELMIEQPELEELINSGSPQAITYYQKLLLYKKSYADEEYVQQIATNLNEAELDIGKEIINQFQIINLLSKYAFLFHPFSSMLMILFIGTLLVKNIAGMFFVLIVKYLPNVEEETNIQITEEKESN